MKIQLAAVTRLLHNNNIELVVADEAIRWLTERGFDPQSGARPVKRLVQKEIVNELSKEIIAGKISRNVKVRITVKEGRLDFSV